MQASVSTVGKGKIIYFMRPKENPRVQKLIAQYLIAFRAVRYCTSYSPNSSSARPDYLTLGSEYLMTFCHLILVFQCSLILIVFYPLHGQEEGRLIR